MGLRRVALVAVCVLGTACDLVTDSFVRNDFSGDPYPIQVRTDNGAVLIGLRTDDGSPDRVAVLDALSPVTLVDPGPDAAPKIRTASLTLLGERSDGAGSLDLPRARLPDKTVIALHPCKDATCFVGPEGGLQPYEAIVGADALAGDALRLKLQDSQVFVLADIGGDDIDRTRACDAVFPAPYRGGGTLVIAGAEIPFGGRRVTLQTCLGQNPDTLLPQAQRGVDALFVLSTGLGISIIGETAYARYRLIRPAAPPVEDLPTEAVFIASGPIEGRRATIDRMALVASSTGDPRAPCRQVYAHYLLLRRNCTPGDDCPCNSGDNFCSVPASVELMPAGGIPMLVVPDADPTLQALRTELRPDQAEVDGILGANAISVAEVDIDYPHNRVLARCRTPECSARPALAEIVDRPLVKTCIGD